MIGLGLNEMFSVQTEIFLTADTCCVLSRPIV